MEAVGGAAVGRVVDGVGDAVSVVDAGVVAAAVEVVGVVFLPSTCPRSRDGSMRSRTSFLRVLVSLRERGGRERLV